MSEQLGMDTGDRRNRPWGFDDLRGAFADRPIFPTRGGLIEENGHYLLMVQAGGGPLDLPGKQKLLCEHFSSLPRVTVVAVWGKDHKRLATQWFTAGTAQAPHPATSVEFRKQVGEWWNKARRS